MFTHPSRFIDLLLLGIVWSVISFCSLTMLNMKNIFPVLFVIINVLLHGQVICFVCKDITSTSALYRLKLYLFCDYDRDIIPEQKNATKIDFGLSIQHYNVVSISSFPFFFSFFFCKVFVNKSKIFIFFFLLYPFVMLRRHHASGWIFAHRRFPRYAKIGEYNNNNNNRSRHPISIFIIF